MILGYSSGVRVVLSQILEDVPVSFDISVMSECLDKLVFSWLYLINFLCHFVAYLVLSILGRQQNQSKIFSNNFPAREAFSDAWLYIVS